VEVEMPDDWNDHAGWNRYYRHRIEQRDWQSSLFDYFFQRDGPELRAAGCQRVWVPGCGITSAPSRLAHMGFEVVATDASSVAVRFQQQAKYRFPEPAVPGGSLTAEVHDFRTDFEVDAFDWILNDKAIQRLAPDDMIRAARVHRQALRPGRWAWFCTWNLDLAYLDRVERTLDTAGFAMHIYRGELFHLSYKRALDRTGVAYEMVDNHPRAIEPRRRWFAPRFDLPQAQAKLDQVEATFAAQAAALAAIPPDARHARIMNGSG
jgi:hypothetical protein